ncbi:MAG TPA: type II toxin-antitoxin system Phd/YefM family antitoxin [Stellaceae bacterium]|jgi:prevent-host-death family protein|nr:type II toxin-antitoxin system Phd/YefM family antitoxin [Stellaceae bacterium]
MRTVNIHEAKTHLSRLVDRAASGESFIIAKSGKPLVKVVPLDAPEKHEIKRIGFLEGRFSIPDDFDTMFAEEIEEMFYGKK